MSSTLPSLGYSAWLIYFLDSFKGNKGFQDCENGVKILTRGFGYYDLYTVRMFTSFRTFLLAKIESEPFNPEWEEQLASIDQDAQLLALTVGRTRECLRVVWPEHEVEQFVDVYNEVIDGVYHGADSKADEESSGKTEHSEK